MCTKIIQHSAREIGKTYKSRCNKPDYKNGLCKYHYDKTIEKQKNWIDRENYKPATIDDILKGRSLKLRNSNQNLIFMYRKGIIKRNYNKAPFWRDTEYPANPDLFCVLDF